MYILFSVNLANLYKRKTSSNFVMNKTFVAGKFLHYDRYTPNPFIIKQISQLSEN